MTAYERKSLFWLIRLQRDESSPWYGVMSAEADHILSLKHKAEMVKWKSCETRISQSQPPGHTSLSQTAPPPKTAPNVQMSESIGDTLSLKSQHLYCNPIA